MNAPIISAIPRAIENAIADVEALRGQTRLVTDFASQLFAATSTTTDGGPETLPPEALARVAISAFEFFTVREAGAAKIRAERFEDGTAETPLTIIEMINDDMPFLLSSVLAELLHRKLTVKFVAHPILHTRRAADGRITGLAAGKTPDTAFRAESFLHIRVEGITQAAYEELLTTLSNILTEVRLVVADWQPMLARVRDVIASYEASPLPGRTDEMGESLRFLKWIVDGNFLLLGTRIYDLVLHDGVPDLEPRAESGLGLLSDCGRTALRQCGTSHAPSETPRKYDTAPALVTVTKGNFLSPVHRRAHVDTVGVQIYSADGKVTGELRIAGLFTAAAYNDSVQRIPLLCHKVNCVLDHSGIAPASYSGRMLINILESYPRDELFQISTEQLAANCTALLELELMPRTRVFPRLDDFRRFASVLVYVRRDRFTTEVRERISALMALAYGGNVTEARPLFTLGPLVRLHVVVWKDGGGIAEVAAERLQAEVEAIVHTWGDELARLLRAHYGHRLNGLFRRYGEAFPLSYQHGYPPARAIQDIERLRKLTPAAPATIDFFRDPEAPQHELRVMLYQLDDPISLSKRVPIFEHFGFSVISESTYELTVGDDTEKPQTVFLHDMTLDTSNSQAIDLAAHETRLEECFLGVWRGDASDDFFNGLIAGAELTWREAALMRAYGSYLRQIGAPFSRSYLATTLTRHGAVTRKLVALFHTLFDPARDASAADRCAQGAVIAAEIEKQLDAVTSLDEDRMLRRYLNLIQATIRTNYYQPATDLTGGPVIALKIRSAKVDGMPAPKPFAEIFITSPRFEGIHLRGGPIARGGLRWSDRPQDFRTEVLGLAKAQQVKNAIIVPQGSKGGFVPRRIPTGAPRDVMMAEGIACYRSFVANLLSVTDNLKDGQPIPPRDVTRLDTDDPYLVVAADKGTATLSDIANSVAVERDFWLGDAFASGGSAGYDHKVMGITARGGWEAVSRHFREMNINIQTTPFRAIGVGDMSGDVFGNAMLLSRQIKLVAAFDHRDIFLDPDPDPAAGWAERKRLFDLPRSSWRDYNHAIISAGGGIFSRNAKHIPLPEPAQRMLGTTAASASPAEVMRLILKARADLLWFGGIGTYVRASTETDEDVNDRANDGIRVTAREIGAKVVGEGANLGVTQRGRIEFALGGGRINTDAIDNSAGVNTSDVEVNIKIALTGAEHAGRLTRTERNTVLAAMTGEVAQTVLVNNHLQPLAISLGERRGLDDLGFQTRLMHALEDSGLLDRVIEKLPSDSELTERREKRQPLTRPELAVLLAYAKIALYFELMQSPVLDDPYLSRMLTEYFPATMRERFAAEIEAHALRREIIATTLANAAINRGGSTFIIRLKEETGRDAGEIASAFAVAMKVFGFAELFAAVDALNNQIDGQRQLDLYVLLQDTLRRQTAWFLRHGRFRDGLSPAIARYREGMSTLNTAIESIFDEWLTGRLEDGMKRFHDDGVPPDLARRFAHLGALSTAPDIISLAIRLDRPELEIARIYFQTSSHFRLEEVRAAAEGLGQADYFGRLAINSALEGVASAQRAIVDKIYASADGGAAPDFTGWCKQNVQAAQRARHSFDAILDGSELTLAKLTVAVAHLRELAEQ